MTAKERASTGTNRSRKSSDKARERNGRDGGASDKPFSTVQVGQLLELTRDIINGYKQQSQTRNPLSLSSSSSTENASNRSGDKNRISSKHNDSSSKQRLKNQAIKSETVHEGGFSNTQMKQLEELTCEIIDQQSKKYISSKNGEKESISPMHNDSSRHRHKHQTIKGKAVSEGVFSKTQMKQLEEITTEILDQQAKRESSKQNGEKDPASPKCNGSSRHCNKHKAINGKTDYRGAFSNTQMKQLEQLTSEILDQQSKKGNDRRMDSLRSSGGISSDMTGHKYSSVGDFRVKVECSNRRALMSECKLDQRDVDDYSISTRMSAPRSEKAETDAANLETKEDSRQGIPDTKPSRSFSFKLPSASASASWETSASTSSGKDMVATELTKIKTMKVREIKKELKAFGVSTDGFVEKSDFEKALADARVKSYRNRKSSERVVLRTSSSNAPRKSSKKEEEAKVQSTGKATTNPSRPAGFANFDDSEMRRIQVFERAAPSVVNVSTFTANRDSVSTNIMEVPLGAGSGFLWDDVGHIVTNYHIVRNAKSLQVAMLTRVYSSEKTPVPNKGQTSGMIDYIRRVYKAKVVGIDNDKDIAVLKIDAPMDDLHPIGLGSSSNLKVGQTALAIGNPFGLDHTLTVGVISGTGREVKSPSGRPIANTIQTDAPINPGNSGGPLLDSCGKLIGMNTSIYSPSGGSAGIGFAIPVDTLKYVVDKLIRDGRIVRPGIGISYLESKLAGSLGISKGVLVLDVPTSSPAFEAGLKGTRRTESGAIAIGDIIIRIETKKIDTDVDLFEALESFQPGDKVKITVIRVESPPADSSISPTTNELTLTTTLVRASCSNIL